MQCCLDSDIYFKLWLVGHCTWFGLFVTDSDLDVSEFSFGKDCLKRVSDNPIFFNDLFISSFIHSFNSYSAFLTWLCQIGFHTSFRVAASNCHCSINSWQISLQINFWTDPIWQNHMRNTIKSYLISTLQILPLLPPPYLLFLLPPPPPIFLDHTDYALICRQCYGHNGLVSGKTRWEETSQ